MLVMATVTDTPQARKRPGDSSLTPVRPPKKALRNGPRLEKRCLNFEGDHSVTVTSARVRHETWSNKELRGLLEFVLFHGDGEVWPQHKRDKYWSSAASFVYHRALTSTKRSGMFLLYILNFYLVLIAHASIVLQLLLVVIKLPG